MYPIFKYSLCVFVIFFKFSDGARILASVPTASYSHQVAFRPIWKELAKRGHEIVLLTTDPMKENITNIKQIDMSFSYQILAKHNISSLVSNHDGNWLVFLDQFVKAFQESNLKQLEHPEVQNLIHNKSEKFDLFMVETVFTTHLGLANRFKVPIIALTSLDAPHELHKFMGNSINPVVNPDSSMPYSYPPSFWQRLIVSILTVLFQVYSNFIVAPREENMNKQIFGENAESLFELASNIDILFMNVNPIFHRTRALSPNTIAFGGGTHIDKTSKPLPRELKTILDNAENGAIYFSLGTNVKSKMLGSKLRKVIMDTFAELPYTILWKFESEEMENKPKNVIISKWFPQMDIFKHPNVKLFITQCGLQSMEEAIMHHIPMVGLPFIADQASNAIILHKEGFGINLDQATLTKEIFKNAILDVMNNSKYKEKVIEMENLLTDVEMTGLEKVIWWTEYVIRHKGAKHLRNPMRSIPFYQYHLLDVIAFLLVIIISVFLVMKKIIRRLFCHKVKLN